MKIEVRKFTIRFGFLGFWRCLGYGAMKKKNGYWRMEICYLGGMLGWRWEIWNKVIVLDKMNVIIYPSYIQCSSSFA
jgi:hypothetical protein